MRPLAPKTFIPSKTDTNSMEPIDYYINEPGIMTEVWDQRDQSCDLAITMADIISMVMRISKKDPYALVSPQPLIDANVVSIAHMVRYTSVYGLESMKTYPFTRVRRDWDLSLYLIRRHRRYKLHGLFSSFKPDEIKKQIMNNFGKGGKRYPILGSISFKDFADPAKARRCIENEEPFCLPKGRGVKRMAGREEAEEHALVITGCNTMSEDPTKHYCRVKNSQGTEWGKDGFSLVGFDVLKYIMIPIYDPKELYHTMVYVALPLKTINTECKIDDTSALSKILEKLKYANADGVMVNVLWGVVERCAPKEYNWRGYKDLFETLKENKLIIQVVICFHEVTEGNFTVSLPSWVLDIGQEDADIFFKDRQQKSTHECLSWGIDDEHVLKGRSALEVYSDLMKDFQSTFSEFLEDGVISVIEIGLGPNGELRYPSCCLKRGWEYPGVGAFQCYDKYMLNYLKKKKAVKDQYEFCDKVPEIDSSYNSEPGSCEFFCNEDRFDSIKSRYFLNWYSQQLIKHGDQVLFKARSIFGNEIVLNAKLSGIHWWYTHKGGSHAAELTAGFFNPCQDDGYGQFLRMLKANKIGLKVTVDRSYSEHPTQSSENPDKWMEKVTGGAANMSHPDFSDDDPVPISSWNVVPCQDKTSYLDVLKKAVDDKHKTSYTAFTYYGLDPLMEARQKSLLTSSGKCMEMPLPKS